MVSLWHLDQAAAYIEETACGLSGYLSFCRAQVPELLRLRGSLTSGHPDPVATTWALSFDDPNARTLEIHRLVQTVLKQGMDEATHRLWAERAVRAVKCAFPDVEFSTWAVCDQLLPQAYARSTPTWQNAWKITRSCYEPWAVRRERSHW